MIADRIRAIRDHFDMTRKSFGEKIYVSQDVINNLERGRVTPTEYHISGICERFNVNEHWLRTGEGEMFNPTNTSLDTLAAANNIDPVTRAIVEGLIEMPAQAREAFIDLIFDISDRIRNSDYEAARPEAVAATASKYFKNFNAAKAENPPEEDRRDLQEPHTV